MTTKETIPGLLATAPDEAGAILAAGRPALSYAALRAQISAQTRQMRGHGVGRSDRVALVLPNGPELASAFLSVAAAAVAAPLNPALSRSEFELSLRELRVRALLLQAGECAALRDLAAALGVMVLDVRADPAAPAGRFDLLMPAGRPAAATAVESAPDPADVALVLQTSGTTARPKTVPLRHCHLAASACHIATTLELGPGDRCLNVMPLFHIHGIGACLLATLAAGGSVYCAAGFNALRFFGELAESGATWYSAVPTIHQAVLSRARRNAGRIGASRLRFIRSSSAALPPSVSQELEAAFGAPVIEAYGMTEAAHQMASNPLPPGMRRPGSVGRAAGPDVGIMDAAGRLLPPGTIGEIVVRGPNIFDGYEDRPEANAESFVDGWFRTGDQGVVDAGGYVTITGRIKEIINRGGEKIAPREIDEALLEHGAVGQAVAFAIPHAVLGESVGAAIVLRDGARATERELLAFAAERLAPFKVPSTLLIVDELPRGATGKVQRLQMAKLLGLT
jgi:oxalate---CoA ligase